MYNCRSYSNATSIDLSKYDKRTVGSYYNPPLWEVFKCPDVEGLTRAQKLKFINEYIKKINKYFGQLKHNLKQAKAYKDDEKLRNTTRHYNYHITQRTQAQKCRDVLIYGGDTATVNELVFPKPAPKPPAPKPTPPSKEQKNLTDILPTSKKPTIEAEKKVTKKTDVENIKPTTENKEGILGLGYKTLFLIVLAIGGTYLLVKKK